jgi:hypothetical protein
VLLRLRSVIVQRNAPAWVTALFLLVAVVLAVVGIVYLTEPAHSLPGFFPGHVAATAKDAGHHHTKHGLAAIIAAVVALAVADDDGQAGERGLTGGAIRRQVVALCCFMTGSRAGDVSSDVSPFCVPQLYA